MTLRLLRVTGNLVYQPLGGLGDWGGGILAEDCAFPVDLTLDEVEVDDNLVGFSLHDPLVLRPGGGIATDTAGSVTIRDSLIHDNQIAAAGSTFGSLGGAGIGATGGGSLLIEGVTSNTTGIQTPGTTLDLLAAHLIPTGLNSNKCRDTVFSHSTSGLVLPIISNSSSMLKLSVHVLHQLQ